MQCSIARLQSALAGNLPADEETALLQHLDDCNECSTALEGMAGGPSWCHEAASLLATDEFDAAVPTREEWSEIDFTVEHLEPADEPDVLGRLGGYDVLEIIGHGGMGVVLKAFDRELKRTVAIKVLAPHLARNSLARKRFAREAQAAAAVVHPHVLAIHQVQASGRLPFLVMPLVAGESLAERLAAQGTLELKEILRIGMQAAAGLAAAHEQGLVHRDVKPANILLEKGVERAVLTDFGLARAADDVTLTRWGVVAGTPQYMSPEQARGEPLDGRSDLFSLGCVLYEMATGVSPFRTDSPLATMRRLVDDSPQPIDAINPELPPWFAAIVHRLLEKDPSHRFQSAAEVSELLENCLAHVQRPAAVPLPDGLSMLTYQPDRASGRFFRKPWARARRLIAGALIASAAVFAGTVIVLELNKGTLTIESQADDVALRITEGDEVVEKLTVTRGDNDVRIAAGKYRVEIDGAADGIAIENGTVTIQRRGSEIVRVVRNAEGHGALKAGLNALAKPQSKANVAQEAERIATEVAGQIEKLKSKYSQLGKFSAVENLRKNRNQATLRQENPLLFEIRYLNGVLNKSGGGPDTKYDEHNGIFLEINFFERNQAGLPGYSLGGLYIGLHVDGPKGEAIRLEIDRFLRSLGATQIGNDGQVLESPVPTSDWNAGPDILDSSITATFLQRSEKTAKEVAEQIDELRVKYPQLKNFSITEHLKKDGKFYVIQYENGLSVQAKKPTDRTYDKETGILLELGFYPRDTRRWLTDPKTFLADPKNESSVYDFDDFLVAMLVSGPAQEPIRAEMDRILKSLGAEELPRATPTIAHLVARRIEELKGRYPQLEEFSALRHFHANTAREEAAPGTPHNPELYSISYHNGVLATGAVPRKGPRRSPEVTFDPQTGIQLNIHFFKGDSRGADPTPPYRIDNLSVHVYVKGPAADAIRGEIIRIFQELGAKQEPSGDASGNPSASPYPAHPPTNYGGSTEGMLPSVAPDAGPSPTVPAPPSNNAAGEPSRDTPAPTPPTAADPPPSNDPQANSPGFSQTYELVLAMNSNKFMLDLDTGTTMDPPATIRPEQGKMDLSTTQVQPYHYPTGLVGHSLQGKEVKQSDWNASVAEVRRALAGNVYALKAMDVGPEKNPTYFFKTRDGALGILQLLEVTDEPKGIRLRYKTLQREQNPKADAVNMLVANMQGNWIVDRLTNGTEDSLAEVTGRRCQLTVEGTTLTFRFNTVKSPEVSGTVTLNLQWPDRTKPQEVDVTLDPNGHADRLPGIIECDGTALKLCMSNEVGSTDRPRAFAPGAKVFYHECRRLGGKRSADSASDNSGAGPAPNALSLPQKVAAIELRLSYPETRPGLVEMNIADGDEKVFVAPGAIATNADIASAEVVGDPSGQPAIQFTFKEDAAKRLAAATEEHQGKPLAILVEGKLLTAPIVRDAIGNKAMINGRFTLAEARRIAGLVNSMPNHIQQFHTDDNVHRIAYSSDGKLLAIANGNPTFILQTSGVSRLKDDWKPSAELLNADTGATVATLKLSTAEEDAALAATEAVFHFEVTALAFSPVENVLAVGTSIGQVKLFNAQSGELIRSLDDETPRLADKETPENWKPMKRAIGRVASLAFSPDGTLLAVSGHSFTEFSDVFDHIERGGLGRSVTGPGRLKLFDAKTGALKRDLAGHSQVFEVAFSADGSLLASAGRWENGNDHGNGVLVWNPQTGEKLRSILIQANGGTHHVAFSPNKKLIATGSVHFDKENDTSSTSIGVTYPLSGITEWQRTLPGWAKPLFTHDGNSLAVLSRGQSINFINVETGQTKQEPTAPFAPPGARFNDVAVSQNGRKLAVGGIDANRRGIILVWPFGVDPR